MDSSPQTQSLDESPMTSSPTSIRSLSPYFFPANDDEFFSPHCDELPVFDLDRSLSPLPIDQCLFSSPYQVTVRPPSTLISPDEDDDSRADYVSLEEIHSLIGTTSQVDEEMQHDVQKLETIFEGIFLDTPPRGQQLRRTTVLGQRKTPKVHRVIFDEDGENVPPTSDEPMNCVDNHQV